MSREHKKSIFSSAKLAREIANHPDFLKCASAKSRHKLFKKVLKSINRQAKS